MLTERYRSVTVLRLFCYFLPLAVEQLPCSDTRQRTQCSTAVRCDRYRYRRLTPGFIAPLFGENSRKRRSKSLERWLSEPHEPALAAVLSAGGADYGVDSPSISNGSPGPQPPTKSRTATTKTTNNVVLITSLPISIGHFLLEDTVSP